MGQPPASVDVPSLRRVLGGFLTGVTVVATTDAQGLPRGMTANSFTSVSLDPPLVLICIGRTASSFTAFASADRFAVSILTEHQKDVSGLFASKAPDKFDRASWRREATGAPVLNDALGWLDCTLHQSVEAGDHIILIGKVEAFGADDGAPLGFHGGRYVTFGVDTEPRENPNGRSYFGALVETEGRLLLQRSCNGWSVPCGRHGAEGRHGLDALAGQCRKLGCVARLSFVYSVFSLDNGDVFIVYRGTPADGLAHLTDTSSDARWFAIDDLPWAEIAERPMRSMLRRYVTERGADKFGIYAEAGDGGRVAVLQGRPAPFGPQHLGQRGS